jgi:KTSC domain
MKRSRVSSSAVASIGYDPRRRVLEVEFASTGVYRYLDVDPTEVDELHRSESKGRYVNEQIKPRHRYIHVVGS